MSDQDLYVWAKEKQLDGLTTTYQRRDLELEEFNIGWLRNSTITMQQLNQILFLLSLYANPWENTPVLFPTSKPIPPIALECNGQSIDAEFVNLIDSYGSNLPDLTGDAPTGFTFIVRKS